MPEENKQPDAPVDKKRLALVEGTCGVPDRVAIRGQVVDIPVTEKEIKSDWDMFLGLPRIAKLTVRPLQDVGMNGVRRARLQAEVFPEKRDGMSPPLWVSEQFASNDNSFFNTTVSKLSPGVYATRVILRGIDSLRQSLADIAFMPSRASITLKKDIIIGEGKFRVLPTDYTGWIITSDIDQTFLDTKIESRSGLMQTLFEMPPEKRPLPGMAELMRQVAKAGMPLHFLSASPHFFRRSFNSLFELHHIPVTGLRLKYLQGVFEEARRKIFETAFHINDYLQAGIGGAVDRSAKFLISSVQSLFDQVGYKLETLLDNRLMQPTGAREVLMGDNTESDHFIFTLYQVLLTGRLRDDQLVDYLYHLKFHGREALTRDYAIRIAKLTTQNLQIHGKINPVEYVWINQANESPDGPEVERLIVEALPEDAFKWGTIKKPVVVRGAVGFALHFLDAGLLTSDQFRDVWKSLEGAKLGQRTLDRVFLEEVLKTFPFQKEDAQKVLSYIS